MSMIYPKHWHPDLVDPQKKPKRDAFVEDTSELLLRKTGADTVNYDESESQFILNYPDDPSCFGRDLKILSHCSLIYSFSKSTESRAITVLRRVASQPSLDMLATFPDRKRDGVSVPDLSVQEVSDVLARASFAVSTDCDDVANVTVLHYDNAQAMAKDFQMLTKHLPEGAVQNLSDRIRKQKFQLNVKADFVAQEMLDQLTEEAGERMQAHQNKWSSLDDRRDAAEEQERDPVPEGGALLYEMGSDEPVSQERIGFWQKRMELRPLFEQKTTAKLVCFDAKNIRLVYGQSDADNLRVDAQRTILEKALGKTLDIDFVEARGSHMDSDLRGSTSYVIPVPVDAVTQDVIEKIKTWPDCGRETGSPAV